MSKGRFRLAEVCSGTALNDAFDSLAKDEIFPEPIALTVLSRAIAEGFCKSKTALTIRVHSIEKVLL